MSEDGRVRTSVGSEFQIVKPREAKDVWTKGADN